MFEKESPFERDYKRAESYVNSHPSEVFFLKKFILKKLPKLIEKIKTENPNATIKELNEIIKKETFIFAEVAFKSAYVFPLYMHYMCCKYLQKKPSRYEELLKTSKNSTKKFSEIYTPFNTFDDYIIFFIRDLDSCRDDIVGKAKEFLSSNPNFLKILDDDNSDVNNKIARLKKYCAKLRYSNFSIKNVCSTAKLYLFDINAILQQVERNLENALKRRLTESICSLAEKMDRLDLLNDYKQIQSSQFVSMDFKEFSDLSNPKKLMQKEILKNYSVDTLMILNSFLLNKYSKELQTFYLSVLYMDEYNLLEKITKSNNTKKLKITDDKIKNVLLKWYTLRIPCEKFIDMQQQAHYKGELSEDSYTVSEDNNYITYSFLPLANFLKNKYNDEYNTKFYDLILKSLENEDDKKYIKNNPTDLKSDVEKIALWIAPISNIYNLKDETLKALLFNLQNNPDINNYGLIPDKISTAQTHISLENNFIGIGFDTNLTFPIREHIRLNVLKDFFKSINGNCIIPLYEGFDDFITNGTYLSTHLSLPFSQEQEKLLRKTISQDNPKKAKPNEKNIINKNNRNFIYHINFLRDSSAVPDIFKTTIIDSKGRTKRVFKKRYVDLETR